MTQRLNSHYRLAAGMLALALVGSPALQAQEIPRTAEGHPDLSGYWAPGGSGVRVTNDSGDVALSLPARYGDISNFEKDSAVLQRAHRNKPLYRPEYWDRIQDLDWNGLTLDPVFNCRPAGVPRVGAPHKIVQTPTESGGCY